MQTAKQSNDDQDLTTEQKNAFATYPSDVGQLKEKLQDIEAQVQPLLRSVGVRVGGQRHTHILSLSRPLSTSPTRALLCADPRHV